MNQSLPLLAVAIVPAAGFLFVVHGMHAAAVPGRFLAGAFLSGAATAVAGGLAEHFATQLFGLIRGTSSFVIAFLLVATVEEAVKCASIKSWFDRLGPDPTIMGTLLLGAGVACGFAAAENIVYVFGYASHGFEVSAIRHFTAVPLHILNGVVFATYLGLGLARPDAAAPAKGFAIVWVAHGFYDYVVFEHRMNLLLLVAIFGVLFWYVRYGLAETRQLIGAERARG